MMTMSYVNGAIEEITINDLFYFGQLWDGCDGDADDLLESGAVSPDGENVVNFDIVDKDAEDVMNTLVRVTDIY